MYLSALLEYGDVADGHKDGRGLTLKGTIIDPSNHSLLHFYMEHQSIHLALAELPSAPMDIMDRPIFSSSFLGG
jgi:hypothetical protein